jgi:hypothetical protein
MCTFLTNSENLKMSKYIPKVGEAFEFYSMTIESWCERPKVFLITDKELVYLDDKGRVSGLCLSKDFRPIKTKADVERDELVGIICNNTSLIHQYSEKVAIKIQQAGFTIPKKVKRSELKKIINHHHGDSAVSYTKTVDILICNLLGDLVEQDEGGDV